jgi:hypothetical protein
MKDILKHTLNIVPLSMDMYINSEVKKTQLSHFNILKELSERNLFPKMYIEFLESMDKVSERNELSKKLLKIYLYAYSKIKDSKKLNDWLLIGTLPEETSFGSSSMAIFSNSVKRINKMSQQIDKTIDKISIQQSKITEKSNKRIQDSLKRNQTKFSEFSEQYEAHKEILEDIIYEIESTLASGRKL